ncbi:M1 family metallopeptidase [Solirubrobacter soli]|uniref:M1 family metallopeptidase n=1 Tax=Solirubrobacter soli TaxID=363832 RepID=UPI0004282BAC|nr:M1 family metallopeptidase [Solirubrobacter soli]
MLAVAVTALASWGAPELAAAHPDPATPGAPSVGDRLFPGLGNGGYDVEHYTLDFTYASAASVQSVAARATIEARATQALSRFDLDFDGDSVQGVSVNGRTAAFARSGEELVVTPRSSLPDHRDFTVEVAYTSGPRDIPPDADLNTVLGTAWFATPSGSITAAQPSRAHRIFPSNDHPSDKASFTIRADTPAGSDFTANGELVAKTTRAGRTRWTYEEREPMATELIQLAFGNHTLKVRGFHRGIFIRDLAPTAELDALEPAYSRELDHLDWMIARVGRYPFRSYGTFASDATFPFALETQTLSLYPDFLFLPPFPAAIYEPIMVHELAHMWFGDDVAPARWSDVWLNEGHATWYEWNYGDEFFGANFEDRIHGAYQAGDQLRALYGPIAQPKYGADDIAKMFSPNIYDSGAVALFALRQVIGERAFNLLERAWVTLGSRRSLTTQDFIALASVIGHRDLRSFMNNWLYSTKTPPMPGHPEWTVDPAGAAAPLRAAASPAEVLLKR